jgi:hypothetical protein
MAEATTDAEAMPAEAVVETKTSIVEIGNSMLNAILQAIMPRGLFSSGPSSVPADALSSARTVQMIPETPTEVEMPTLKPESAAASHLAPPPAHRHSIGPKRPDALDNGDDTNLDDIDDDDDAKRPFGACCRPSRRKRRPKRKLVDIDPEVKRELSALDSGTTHHFTPSLPLAMFCGYRLAIARLSKRNVTSTSNYSYEKPAGTILQAGIRFSHEVKSAAQYAAAVQEALVKRLEDVPASDREPVQRFGRRIWESYGGAAVDTLLEHTPCIDIEYLIALGTIYLWHASTLRGLCSLTLVL